MAKGGVLYVIRLIGTAQYIGKYAPAGTNIQNAVRFTGKQADERIEASKKKNGGTSRLEKVPVWG